MSWWGTVQQSNNKIDEHCQLGKQVVLVVQNDSGGWLMKAPCGIWENLAYAQVNTQSMEVTDLRIGSNSLPVESSLLSTLLNNSDDIAGLTAGELSVCILDIIQAVFERSRGNRAATMRRLFPGMKVSYFGRVAWDLVKMNPALLDPDTLEGKRFSQFSELKQAYLNTRQSREKIKMGQP
jgi:hypothetical protein